MKRKFFILAFVFGVMNTFLSCESSDNESSDSKSITYEYVLQKYLEEGFEICQDSTNAINFSSPEEALEYLNLYKDITGENKSRGSKYDFKIYTTKFGVDTYEHHFNCDGFRVSFDTESENTCKNMCNVTIEPEGHIIGNVTWTLARLYYEGSKINIGYISYKIKLTRTLNVGKNTVTKNDIIEHQCDINLSTHTYSFR